MPRHTIVGKLPSTNDGIRELFYEEMRLHWNRDKDPKDALRVTSIVGNEIRYIDLDQMQAKGTPAPKAEAAPSKVAIVPNVMDCDGCQAWDSGKGCLEGNYPETCGHKVKLKAKPVIVEAPALPTNEIPTHDILITGWNPRRHFDEDKIRALAADIEANGLHQAVLVRPKGSKYELVVGERRLKAFRVLKRDTIPATVKDLTDEQVLAVMLSENLQREDLNPIEEANHLKRMLEVGNLTQTELAKRIGMSQEWVSNRLRIAEAPAELQDMIIRRRITSSHVLDLLDVKDAPKFNDIMCIVRERVKDEEAPMTRAHLRAIIKDLTRPEPEPLAVESSIEAEIVPDDTSIDEQVKEVEAIEQELGRGGGDCPDDEAKAEAEHEAKVEPEPKVCPMCGGTGWI
jgi:ParB/RepB/Spo0J family partition protein